MRQIALFGIAVFLLIQNVCGQASPNSMKEDIYKDWKTINEIDYSIRYPASYEINRSGLMGMSFLILSKQTSKNDLFRENVNLHIDNLAGRNISLDKYVEISENQIKTMLENGKLLVSRRLRKGDKEFQKMVFKGKQGKFDLKWQQYYWVEKDKAYVLTLTCEEDQYDNYLDIGQKIMNSFKIK